MIKIIDLFAGPGGLGEGFTAINRTRNRFSIAVSVEMDAFAHKTLLLRAFYRQFKYDQVPDDYFNFIKSGKYSLKALNELLEKYPRQGTAARNEALCLELGKDDEEIFKSIENAIGNSKADKEKPLVLIGGPPCQAYSLVGRARNKGIEDYSLDKDKRSKLYREYLRILARFQPAVFVMENVKGMLSAVVDGDKVIKQITKDLQDPAGSGIKETPFSGNPKKYRLYSLTKAGSELRDIEKGFEPEDFLIRCEDHGIPQKRHRVIILGVREDIKTDKISLLKKIDPVAVKNVIFDLPPAFSMISHKKGKMSDFDTKLLKHEEVSPMLKEYFRKQNKMPDNVWQTISSHLDKVCEKKSFNKRHLEHADWYGNAKLGSVICNHEPRTHMRSDFLRYYFVCCYGKATGMSPTLEHFPKDLLPAHKNINSGKFVDRFKVQLEDQPATTITSHISKDGHYYIHPDPQQCRSLTVREAARIQTFPDDYFFCGNRTQQYHQVGNAVPPLLAKQIAEIVWEILADHI